MRPPVMLTRLPSMASKVYLFQASVEVLHPDKLGPVAGQEIKNISGGPDYNRIGFSRRRK